MKSARRPHNRARIDARPRIYKNILCTDERPPAGQEMAFAGIRIAPHPRFLPLRHRSPFLVMIFSTIFARIFYTTKTSWLAAKVKKYLAMRRKPRIMQGIGASLAQAATRFSRAYRWHICHGPFI